jgi:hypothetical protein
MDYSDKDDDIRRGENEDMDDLGEDESDEEESGNDDDEEDENDDGIESEEEEEVEVHDKSVHKFIRTFHNGDYDKEFVNALSSDRAVPLPTTQTTQASYNKLDNWRERNRIGLEETKRLLQNCTDSVMRGKSLSLCFIHNVSHLQLTHCDLGSSPEILSVILQSDVNRIILDNNNIDSLGAVKIAEYLEGDPRIEYMSLGCNRLNDDDAILIS